MAEICCELHVCLTKLVRNIVFLAGLFTSHLNDSMTRESARVIESDWVTRVTEFRHESGDSVTRVIEFHLESGLASYRCVRMLIISNWKLNS